MMEEKTFQTDLGTIHYWTVRTGKPWLVFLPGLTADHRLFDLQIEELGREFSCLVWDAPGHGASRPFRLDFSMEDLAGYLQKILEREQIERPVLIGQSLGGYICQIYMRLDPDAAAGFVSIDSCSMHRRGAWSAQAHQMDVLIHPLELAETLGRPGDGLFGIWPRFDEADDGGI